MHTAPHLAGPHDPVTATPPRRRGSLRRTATIDSRRPDGLAGLVVVDARARDLRTTHAGEAVVDDECRVHAVIDGMTRRFVEATSDRPWVSSLAGKRTGQKFRSQLAEVAPSDLAVADPLLLLLLDDVPGSQLVAGFALHSDPGHSFEAQAEHLTTVTDVCAGWAADASIIQQVRLVGEIPTPTGPPAPLLPDLDLDPHAWHDVEPLGPHGMRRLRRLEVGPSQADPSHWWFDVHFRDSHMSGEGEEEVVHEYVVTGTLDPHLRHVTTISTEARVLPWLECPQAVASAGRVVGRPLADLRAEVLAQLVGTTTCTHLNDVLRTLADLDPILTGWT